MSQILFAYEPMEATTWAYLSSLLMIGLFFKFNRFWSVRNADLLLLILLAPGMLLVYYGNQRLIGAEQNPVSHSSMDNSESGQGSPSSTGIALRNNVALGSSQQDDRGDVPKPEDDPSDEGSKKPGTSAEIDSAAADVVSESTSSPIGPGESTHFVEDPRKASDVNLSADEQIRWWGYALLLGASVLLLIRLLIDPTMVRRPLLEPNLSTGGLIFIGCSLFMFLMANVIATSSTKTAESNENNDKKVGRLEDGATGSSDTAQNDAVHRNGPVYVLLLALPQMNTMPSAENQQLGPGRNLTTAKIIVILSHLLIVFGMIAIGYRHFGNIRTGIASAAMYLMMPYTAVMTGFIDHALPAALLTWALVFYRRPMTAGICLGLAGGMIYYPLFVLPLWISFYWQRGLGRFLSGLLIAMTALIAALGVAHIAGLKIQTIPDSMSFMQKLSVMFGVWAPRMSGLQGVWVDGGYWDPIYRTPIIFAFIALAGTFAIWPAQKNLGTLLSCTAAIMVAAQCWHGSGGGVYMAWFLPLLLLTFLRPNLEDRVALTVLSEGWSGQTTAAAG